MKIERLAKVIPFVDRVKEKRDEDKNGQGQKSFQEFLKDQNKKEEEHTPEEVKKAVDEFARDNVTNSLGLQASVEESGAGLRVTLQDSKGNKIRILTGQEFIELRNNSKTSAPTTGKLLDKKY